MKGHMRTYKGCPLFGTTGSEEESFEEKEYVTLLLRTHSAERNPKSRVISKATRGREILKITLKNVRPRHLKLHKEIVLLSKHSIYHSYHANRLKKVLVIEVIIKVVEEPSVHQL
jgi:hypothetical protein